MIVLAALAFLLVLALVATQLKLRALAETVNTEKVRTEAQRSQFERDTRVLKSECDGIVAAAEARENRWKSVVDAARTLLAASQNDQSAAIAALFAAVGHFRVIAVRVRDAKARNYALGHLFGLPEEAAAKLRETRVPEPVLRGWFESFKAYGPGVLLRARPQEEGEDGSSFGLQVPMSQQDALLIPFRDEDGRVEMYVSLAQPEPPRLPDSDELAFYAAVTQLVSAHLERLSREVDGATVLSRRVRESQMEATAISAFQDTLVRISEKLDTGLSNLEGYAQNILDYASDLPREEQGRLATAIVEESRELREETVLVKDLVELTASTQAPSAGPVEFADLYTELLQFLLHRAESRGVTLNGPPLQGGIYLERPAGVMKRLLALTSNELLSYCRSGDRLSLSAWQDQGQIHINWRASGKGVPLPEPGNYSPRWIAAQATAHALGGSLRESTMGADNRSVSLSLPLAPEQSAEDRQAA